MKSENISSMDIIHSIENLKKIRTDIHDSLELRDDRNTLAIAEAKRKGIFHLMLCFGTGCISSGANKVKKSLFNALVEAKLTDRVSIIETGCNGFCAGGPIVVVYPGGYFYHKVSPEDAAEIVSEHILQGKIVEKLLFRHPVTGKPIEYHKDIPFFGLQNARVLHNKGRISHESIEEYIGFDGYFGLYHALHELTPEEIIAEVKRSGLRGRGGAGFPAGVKWELCRNAKGDKKYILCNADEGDPGAFMDRSLIESDPHAVIEGMMIAARAIGAQEGYIYCRAEYPLALERLNHSIAECRRRGLLGSGILGTDFCFDIHISLGSGAFVCGEETALMRSIEGQRGEPRPRPPFPANKGLWDYPSTLNNVETFGNFPLILRKGAEWFRSVGTEKSPGTKIFALTGKVNNLGLVEVDMGIPLGDIIYDIGGGIPDGKKYKAAQIGGPSGGCIPREHLNVPVDYESLAELGAIMGSGGLIVMDEDSCMVDMARYFLDFVQDESCGKCVPCRVGTKRMHEILERICKGEGEMADIDRLINLGNQIKDTALCGLGQTAPNPVLSTIRHFRDEYISHIRDKHCPAGVCPELVRTPCSNACPAGVDVPGFVSLVGEKRYREALAVHRERNPLAAICAAVCFHPCESKCRRATIDDSIGIRGIKRFMVEKETTTVLPEIRKNAENAKRKIAIIGAGPAGLSCSYFLTRMGFLPRIFEAENVAGGMLVQTIPSYRLPRQALAKEIRMIEEMGVKIETGVRLGKDITLKELRDDGYEAVFLGLGAPLGSKLGIKGEKAVGVMDGIEFLRAYNLTGNLQVGKHVAIIGGGNVAVDVARTALRLGAQDVTILYRRTREEMPAYEDEVQEALREGVKFDFLTAPQEIITADGKAAGVKCNRMVLGDFDKSGRRRPMEKAGNEYIVPADQVVAAIGQSLNTAEINNGISLKLDKKQYLETDPVTGRTSEQWIFAGGDAATGPASVIEAIAAGEKAAVGISKFLTGKSVPFWRAVKTVDTLFDPDADPVPYRRAEMPLVPVKKRKNNFREVEVCWKEKVAILEAKRCLRCDYRDSEIDKSNC